MKCILITSNEDLVLARQEILCNSKHLKQDKNVFIADCNPERFTYVNFAFKKIKKPYCKNSFKFEFYGTEIEEAETYIKELQNKGAKVILKNPEKIFTLVKFKQETILCEKIYENKKDFMKRNPKKRPGFHPGACNSKFAKTLVNLTGLNKKQKLLDPFCGTGGILIESEMIGISATGYDKNESMIDKAKKNISHYNLKSKVFLKDALEINKSFDAIATELPFGHSTKIDRSVENLLKDFCEKCFPYCDKMVVAVPSKKKYSTPGYKITFNHDIYIHKSLSKKILILDKLKSK